jgi:sigma-B regulation protein RsbU (phosphoserine phosphatase)
MRTKKEISFIQRSTRAGLFLVIVAAVTLEATSLIQYYFSQKGIKEEAALRADSEMEATKLKIIDVIDQAESAVRNSVWIAQWCLEFPDSLKSVARRIVEDNPVVMGSTVALVPGYSRQHPLFSPYVFREPGCDSLQFSSLATPEYDYPSQEWFAQPIELDAGYWSEPYVDDGGGNVLMVTYSLPIKDKKGRTAAVVTADISLDWLTSLVGSLNVYPSAFSMVFSRNGNIMVGPENAPIMQTTFLEAVKGQEDTAALNNLGRSMLSGGSGIVPISYKGRKIFAFYAPVERTGWSMSIFVPEDEIFGNIRRLNFLIKLLQILGIVMLILILRAVSKSQMKYQKINENKERIENELKIASNIQMSMIPKRFPTFPDRIDLDLAGNIVPAKEVGGDLYDFFIRDEKLFFCIGDVSGKGVPAALVMAVTRSLFRNVAGHEDSPQRIVSDMNASLSDMNESNMFVTFFCGVLDLTDGHLRYCNAGHNAPMILTTDKRILPTLPNLPLGIMPDMEYKEQERYLCFDDAIFLYTDGVTEAENTAHEQFGEERMSNVLSERRSSSGHLKAMEDAVAAFVGGADPSDDITMLFIHYLNDKAPESDERHLTLHNDINQIPRLASFIDGIAESAGLDMSLCMSLNLAMEEAVTNVMLYAYPKGTDGIIDVEAYIHPDMLEFTISDSGVEFDPTAAPEADTSLKAEDRKIGGLGIHLVRQIMDSVTYTRENGKNFLSMTKKL